MVHDASADNCGIGPGAEGRCIDFSISGADVDVSFSRYYTASGPLSQYLMLTGDAYWDDVAAGTGDPPALVPLPAAAWLLVSALGVLGARARRR
ncbi:VPLPA-CTERM sorting domain-containing protein [Gammaproteobacteria bacterium PRO2]|nr:VPLPA-CTERM sorting domain-containing protein [Gammaproteobacteria bacterium PRO2]